MVLVPKMTNNDIRDVGSTVEFLMLLTLLQHPS